MPSISGLMSFVETLIEAVAERKQLKIEATIRGGGTSDKLQ
jgi:hypothetical protein